MSDTIRKALKKVQEASKSGELRTSLHADSNVQTSWGPAMRR